MSVHGYNPSTTPLDPTPKPKPCVRMILIFGQIMFAIKIYNSYLHVQSGVVYL